MDDDDDYLSDKFLIQAAQTERQNESKLARLQRQKREAAAAAALAQQKSRTVVEKEVREQGLAAPIPSTNKGFALLAKMGYRPPTASETNSNMGDETIVVTSNDQQQLRKREEPIPLIMKNDRMGLGLKSKLEEEEENRLRQQQKDGQDTMENFGRRIRQKCEERRLYSELKAARLACEQLDLKRHEMQQSLLDGGEEEEGDDGSSAVLKKRNIFWMPLRDSISTEADASVAIGVIEDELDDRGRSIVRKRRHLYEDGENREASEEVEQEIKQSKKPRKETSADDFVDNDDEDDYDGSKLEQRYSASIADYEQDGKGSGDGDGNDDDDERDQFESLEVPEKLKLVTEYLRKEHHYCIWCGFKYEDAQQMDDQCPGNSYDVHQ